MKQFGNSKAEMQRWKVFQCLRSFFKGREGISAAQPMDVHEFQSQNGSQIVDEQDRSKKLEDLKLEDWPLENSFKLVSDFLDSMRSNTQNIEPKMSIKTSSLTIMGIADILPEYYASDNGLLERNLYSSDTKNERISISPSISLSQDSVSNSHFPGTNSPLFASQLLPCLLKYSIEPTSAERGLQDYIQVDQPIFINWLHSGSTKSRPTGHRRGRPPRTSGELSWHKVLFLLHRGRRRGRPPRSVFLLPWSHRPKGHRRGGPLNNYHRLETHPVSIFFFIGCPDTSCFLHVLLLSNDDAYPQPELHSISFQGWKRCRQGSTYHSAILCRAFKFVYFWLSSYAKECSTIKVRELTKVQKSHGETAL